VQVAAISVRKDAGRTLIYRRQNGTTWLLSIPYLMLFCFELGLPFVALYRVIKDYRDANFMNYEAAVLGLLFAAKVVWFGLFLYRMLAAKSEFVIQGATLQASCGQAGRMEDLGTYSASSLTDLSFESGKNLVLPAGKITARIGDISLVLANYLSDADGSSLVDELCETFPFSTPDAAPSPAVVHW
jgi:hypothetical protein